MATTYLRWRQAFLQGKRKRTYLFFGSERFLIEGAIRALSVGRVVTTYYADESEAWRQDILQHSFDEVPRVFVVRNADAISDWNGAISEWKKSRSLHTLIFVDPWDAIDSDATTPVRKTGTIVRVGPFTDDQAVNLLVALSRGMLTKHTAEYLYLRVGSSVEASFEAVKKARLFTSEEIPKKLIDSLTVPDPSANFIKAVFQLKHGEAMSEAAAILPEEMDRVIGSLDYRLDAVAKVGRLVQKYEAPHTAMKQGVNGMVVKEVTPLVKVYRPQRIEKAQRALAVIDDAYAKGVETGLVETLVALW